ncbi:UV DNA damage repair endonuclease UvsE [Paenibacillus sp.]|uniref:UV DNA damage repair endonuclease UvsE n=1 Tax=Paenibacillus sp. TaxID=58172 RepID=UPI002D32387B|nr:UV DNA damage repair endonuclease UvsE [Paenibacillus sp.]HZG55190.1 UV DNA damage repair endonuclease UvsE [Paenibacillus sp.]
MIVRFGYVAMSVHIKNASPSKTMTATHFQTIADREAAVRKLERIAAENLHNTLRLLRHNRGEGIPLYRLSSKLVPLLTHELLEGWDPLDVLEPDFRAVGDYAKTNGMRLSFHPDHFTVLSSPRKEVLAQSAKDLDWHVAMLERMGLDERYKCNIHIGGTYGDKAKAFERFLRQFGELPARIRHRITLENDDKTFTAKETLEACKAVGVPMVLDLHHHAVNNEGEQAEELWADIRSTWEAERLRIEEASRSTTASADAASSERAVSGGGTAVAEAPAAVSEELLAPKIHVSSPKSEKDPRGHADYVNADHFYAFVRAIAADTPRLDVMIEAKQKDDALFRLVKEIAEKPGVRRLGGAMVEL